MLNIGIIGCGWAGEQHVRAFSKLEDVKILAVADVVWERAEAMAEDWGIKKHYGDYKKILSDSHIEAVSICLPHYLHSCVTVESAKAGKHIFCEKPMANTLEEADAMIDSTDSAGVTLMVAETVRFQPINLELERLITQKRIGEVFLARIFRDHEMHDYLRERPWFLDKKKAGGGIWMSGGIHDIDALRMLLGEVDTICAFQAKSVFSDMEGDDTVAALLRFVDGAVGVVTESFSTKTFKSLSPNGCPRILNGSKGTIRVHGYELEIFSEEFDGSDACLLKRVTECDVFMAEAQHFVECVRLGKTPITSGIEERRTLAVVCAGYESMSKGGTPVSIEF
jgi:predicted dehydrogenase